MVVSPYIVSSYGGICRYGGKQGPVEGELEKTRYLQAEMSGREARLDLQKQGF